MAGGRSCALVTEDIEPKVSCNCTKEGKRENERMSQGQDKHECLVDSVAQANTDERHVRVTTPCRVVILIMKSNQVTTVCDSLGRCVLRERSFFARRSVPVTVQWELGTSSDIRWKTTRLNQIRAKEKTQAVMSVPALCPYDPTGCSRSLACSDHPCRIDVAAVHATVCSMPPFQSANVHATGVDAATVAVPGAFLAHVAEVEPV